ncbi:O-antigen ligase [Polynucleobacter sp. AM-7D1]|uniref:O-antigen ligase family protein n=1 Tax=Polynucleobacter sp. AM-7D1 TaxID=2689102 RepID=UPI001BFDB4EE|nr:O-antigen ligase family protein [Polynucleobacter sp. AM-7D1]QWE28105.1 O-antigen ligase family protein [Polynucleobacter sp. AM-7D1]
MTQLLQLRSGHMGLGLLIDVIGRYAVIGVAFALPISTALSNIFLGLVLVCWLASGQYKDKFRLFINNPIALASTVLFTWLAISLVWVDDLSYDQVHFFRKYSNLLFVSIFIWFFLDKTCRSKVIFAFSISMLLTLALSYLAAFGLLPSMSWLHATPGNATIFRLHITQNLMMSLAALIFSLFSVEAWRGGRKFLAALWGLACLLALINVMVMVQGRTGYLVVAAFIVLVFGLRAGWRGLLIAGALVCLGSFAVYEGSDSMRKRVNLAVSEYSNWQSERPVSDGNSIGSRLEFYVNSFNLVSQRPLVGYGLGSFPVEYKRQVDGTGRTPTNNPHNEALLLLVQAGIPALLLFLYLLVRLALAGRKMSLLSERVLAPALALWMGVGGVVNALLIDHAESLLFSLMMGLLAAASIASDIPRSPENGTPVTS